MKKILISKLLLLVAMTTFAQNGNINGTVYSANGTPVEGVTITIGQEKSVQTRTDKNGNFQLQNVPLGEQIVVVSAVGYKKFTENVFIVEDQIITKNFELAEDLLDVEKVVITATRNEVPQYKAPVIVSRISSRVFETTQSLALSEGLNFTPGLRFENNCQNCGFSQVRMNGLEGPYSQILVNSRSTFSTLMGVYGLDMIPTNMIDRVEVVRGGGSVLYGGNAIAGTINIITKDPMENTFEIGTNMSFTDFDIPDRTVNINGSLVSDDFQKGMSFYAYNRDRKPFDANDDGFSEMTLLKNTTWGADAFWNTSELSKLKLNLANITEYRRGGNKFGLANHQTDVTEQVDHKILTGGMSFEQYSSDLKHKFSIYTSAQTINRDSYYGAGGGFLEEGNVLTGDDVAAINAYGKSKDLTLIDGVQYSYEFSEKLLWLSGAEYNKNKVEDNMPGYERFIDQEVGTVGAYTQFEIKPIEKLSFLLGARYDNVDIKSKSFLGGDKINDNKSFDVFVPRITAMYLLSDNLKARASFSQGYRCPQAFDEDLHTAIVGGDILFTILDPNLKTELSDSFNASLNFTKTIGKVQTNIVVEGFFTRLKDAFITTDPTELTLPSGTKVDVHTKRNSAGVEVAGVNLEANFAFSRDFNLQLGATIQETKYKEVEEIWADETDPNDNTTTKVLLRTPDTYAYYTLNYNPISRLKFSLSGVYTGKMDVPHMIDPSNERLIIEKTPTFFENNFKVAYQFDIKDNGIEIYTGIQNVFNQYQKDFDKGAERDPDYVYGPSRPRTFFVGLKYKIK